MPQSKSYAEGVVVWEEILAAIERNIQDLPHPLIELDERFVRLAERFIQSDEQFIESDERLMSWTNGSSSPTRGSSGLKSARRVGGEAEKV